VFLPVTLLRHNLKEELLRLDLMSFMVSCSFIPNCASIASKVVLSSQAISMILEISDSLRFITLTQQSCILQIRHHIFL